MKLLIFTFSLTIIISTFCSLLPANEARHEPIDDYWKKVMKDEPMPEAIQKLFPKEEEEEEKKEVQQQQQQQLAVEAEEEEGSGKVGSAASVAALVKTERFSNKFGSKSNFIIYHTLSTKHHNPFSVSVPPNH